MTTATVRSPVPSLINGRISGPIRSSLARAVEVVLHHGMALCTSLVATLNAAPKDPTPAEDHHFVQIYARSMRVLSAIIRATFLSMTLEGVYIPYYRPRPKPANPATPAPRTAKTLRRPSFLRLPTAKADMAYFRRRLATQPVSAIVAALCRDFGIKRNSELWPAELVAIHVTALEAREREEKSRQNPATTAEAAPIGEQTPVHDAAPNEENKKESSFLEKRAKKLSPLCDTS